MILSKNLSCDEPNTPSYGGVQRLFSCGDEIFPGSFYRDYSAEALTFLGFLPSLIGSSCAGTPSPSSLSLYW